MKKLQGIVTAVPTMIDEHQVVREDWIAELTQFILTRGVDGLYPCGTTGEMLYLTVEERKLIAKTIVDKRNEMCSKALVYIHAGASRIDDTVDLIQHAQKIGADGVGIVTPWYYRLDDLALYDFYNQVFSEISSDFPVYVYNIPQLSGNDLKPTVIKELRENYKNLVGIKYSFSDFNRLKEYVAINDVDVLVGADVQMVESMMVGAVGTVSGLSAAYPEIFVEINRLFKEGRYNAAIELEQYAYELGCIMCHGGNLSMFKSALELRGLPKSVVRPPLRNMTFEEEQQFTKKLSNWQDKVRKAYDLIR